MKNPLADIVLVAHLLWVAGVVVPIPLIFIGARKNWKWVRSYPLRITHLVMISIVAAESLLGVVCPLTTWENALRSVPRPASAPQPFIEYWVGRILYYNFPTWVFTTVYVAFGLLIFALFWKVPPRRVRVLKKNLPAA
jgi:hypothetical protein